jgi:hypothetical protein
LFYYSARIYSAKIDRRGCFDFRCAACGHQQSGWVCVSGEGGGHAPYGLFAESAKIAAIEVAEDEARRSMALAIYLVSCPECGYRENAVAYIVQTLVGLVAIGLTSLLLLACAAEVAIVAAVVCSAAWLMWRGYRYHQAVRDGVTKFVGYS